MESEKKAAPAAQDDDRRAPEDDASHSKTTNGHKANSIRDQQTQDEIALPVQAPTATAATREASTSQVAQQSSGPTSPAGDGQSAIGLFAIERAKGVPRYDQPTVPAATETQETVTRKEPPVYPPAATRQESARAKKSTTIRKHDTAIDGIPMTNQEALVLQAARLVAEELRSASWPEATPGCHVQMAAALEQFAKDIFLPTLISQGNNNTESSEGRPFVATMLALREVMTQNADRIFGRDRHGEGNGVAAGDEGVFAMQGYSTGVIFAAIDRLDSAESEAYSKELERVMDGYDRGESEFSSCLEPANVRTQGIVPGGTVMDPEENVSWKVSFNFAREKHPLIAKEEDSSSDEHRFEVATTNACFVSMVETMGSKKRRVRR